MNFTVTITDDDRRGWELERELNVQCSVNGSGGIELDSAILVSGVDWFDGYGVDLDVGFVDSSTLSRIGFNLLARFRKHVESRIQQILIDRNINAKIRQQSGDDE